MAIATLQIPQANINNAVDPSQWSQLGNLGNVYRQAQEDAAKRATLANLGQGVDADTAALLHSGVPSLAQIGLNMQQSALNRQREDTRYAVTDKRADEQLAIQQAAAKRAQEDWEKKDEDEQAAAKLIAGLSGRQAAPTAPVTDPAFTQGAAPIAASPSVAQPPQQPPVAPPQQAVPLAPGQMPPGGPSVPLGPQAPVAPSPIDPSQLASTTAAAPPSVVDRVASNLTSGQPAGSAGISRDQLAELYRNPLTRPIATAFLQKQFSPGTWKYEKLDDGRLVAANETTGETKDVTPPSAGGGGSKQEAEVQGYYRAGINLGMNPDQARAYAANKGKTPSEDLHPDERKKIGDLTDMANTGQRVIDNINELKQISPKAWGFPGAQTAAEYTAGYLPRAVTPQGAIDTQDLTNAARLNVTNLAKSIFGARVTNQDLKLLQEVEGSANQTDDVRQKIFARATEMIQKKMTDAKTEAEGIRNKTFFKPGGGAPSGGATDPLGIR